MIDVYSIGQCAKEMRGLSADLIDLSNQMATLEGAAESLRDRLADLGGLMDSIRAPAGGGDGAGSKTGGTPMDAVRDRQREDLRLQMLGVSSKWLSPLSKAPEGVPTSTDASNRQIVYDLARNLGIDRIQDIVAATPLIAREQAVIAAQTGKSQGDIGAQLGETLRLIPDAQKPGAIMEHVIRLGDAIVNTHGAVSIGDLRRAFETSVSKTWDASFRDEMLTQFIRDAKGQGGSVDSAMASLSALSRNAHGAMAAPAMAIWRKYGLADGAGVKDLAKLDASPYAFLNENMRNAVMRVMGDKRVSANAAIALLSPDQATAKAISDVYFNAGAYTAAGTVHSTDRNIDAKYHLLQADPSSQAAIKLAQQANAAARHPIWTQFNETMAKINQLMNGGLDEADKLKSGYDDYQTIHEALKAHKAAKTAQAGEAAELLEEALPPVPMSNRRIMSSPGRLKPLPIPALQHADYIHPLKTPALTAHPNGPVLQALARAPKSSSPLDAAHAVRTASLAHAAGADTARGVAEGVKSGQGAVAAAAVAMADSAVKQFKTSTEIASPSRVFAMLGRQLVAGLVLGVREAEPSLLAIMGGLALRAVTPWTKGAPVSGPLAKGAPAKGPWEQPQRPALVAPRQDGGERTHSSPVYLDGKKVGQIITRYLAHEAGRAQSGASGFDPTMGLTPVGMGYGPY